MAFSMDTVVGDVLANPEAVKIMDEIMPGTSSNPMMKMAKGFTLGKIAKTPAAKQRSRSSSTLATQRVSNPYLLFYSSRCLASHRQEIALVMRA